MSAFTSWLLALLWISVLALAELGILLAILHLPKAFPRAVAYLRSVVDDPDWPGKMSMSRTCAIIALLDAVWTVRQFVLFAVVKDASVGMAGVVAGVIGGLTALAASFILRKKADGSTEPVDDVKPTKEHAAAQTTVTVDTKSGASQ